MIEHGSYRAEAGRHRRLGRAAAAAILSSEQQDENNQTSERGPATCETQAEDIARDSTAEAMCVRVAAILGKSPYLPLRTLRCSYDHGKLTLSGEVPTFYLKQLAQSVVSRINGPHGVMNLIRVAPPGARNRTG